MAAAGLDAAAKTVGGNITSIFLVGWAVGRFGFGILADRLGRVRTMALGSLQALSAVGNMGAALAPLALGNLAAYWSRPGNPAYGLRVAASVVAAVYLVGFAGVAMAPETKGRALPA